MRRASFYTVSITLTAAIALQAILHGQIPPRDRGLAPGGSAVIRGRVVAAETGRPLRVAIVALSSSSGSPETQYTITDDAGSYEFRDLPAGRYTVTASTDSYLTLAFGQTRPFQNGRPLSVANAQVLEHVDLALPRGATIGGEIVDEFGEPVIQATVTVLKLGYQGGQPNVSSTGRSGHTDDRGQFRVSGLQPGSYYVAASKRPDSKSGAAQLPSLYAPGIPNLGMPKK